ncbi:hypothetical protein, conserved [Babesia bigemina]|uniref:Uncharacterized protein n=1 Tax=Babesia bigemina TaxID=5866 RepID=A0A061DCK3_BABBI|nr:hypothetical protein, conserved [Babesia bigemina]CDR95620.1 hypothetical protein, conserved [Babesia bigemina]|eukprot:XP_012767806.1 hypothetical protein, conserved [Babesia bigemina]
MDALREDLKDVFNILETINSYQYRIYAFVHSFKLFFEYALYVAAAIAVTIFEATAWARPRIVLTVVASCLADAMAFKAITRSAALHRLGYSKEDIYGVTSSAIRWAMLKEMHQIRKILTPRIVYPNIRPNTGDSDATGDEGSDKRAYGSQHTDNSPRGYTLDDFVELFGDRSDSTYTYESGYTTEESSDGSLGEDSEGLVEEYLETQSRRRRRTINPQRGRDSPSSVVPSGHRSVFGLETYFRAEMDQRGYRMGNPGADGAAGAHNQGQQPDAWAHQMQTVPYYNPQQHRMEFSAPMVMRPMSDSPHATPGAQMVNVPYANPLHVSSQPSPLQQNHPTHGHMQHAHQVYAAGRTNAMQAHPAHQQMMHNPTMSQHVDMQRMGANSQMGPRPDGMSPDKRQYIMPTGHTQSTETLRAQSPKMVSGSPTQVPSPRDTTNQTPTKETSTPPMKPPQPVVANPLLAPQCKQVQASLVAQQSPTRQATPTSPLLRQLPTGTPKQLLKPPEPPKPDLCRMDCGKFFAPLVEAMNFDSATQPSGLSLDDKFEQFGNSIAAMLQQQAQILETCQLQVSDADAALAEGSVVNVHKLDAMTEASSGLFANISTLSQQMHEMVDELPPFYTRSSHYFRNLEIKVGDFTSFSHTHVPEAAVAAHLVRLQDELLKEHQPPGP